MGRDASDEAYVLNLCDRVLGEVGSRQHRFDWLRGDPGRTGRRVRLPVDGYWAAANLVVEYRERQHDQRVPHFYKPERLTVSGVHRGLQRALYDARRDELIPQHGIRLVIITPTQLNATPRGRLRRNEPHDLPVLRRILTARLEPEIRLARRDDADALFQMASQLATSTHPERSAFTTTLTQILADPHSLLLVADSDHGHLVGYLHGLAHPAFHSSGNLAWVEELWVDPAHRRQGVARSLMTRFETWAGQAAASEVALATRRARAFYEAIGYTVSADYLKKRLPRAANPSGEPAPNP